MSALLDGIYDGEMTIGELLGHGNFGLGTFDGLDGEMVILDGVCWQLRSDGTATRADLDARTPFAVVTNFVPHITAKAPDNLARKDVSALIDSLIHSQNYMYALRITGDFADVTTRIVVKQEKPYPKMVEATQSDAVVHMDHVSGTIAGFRTPVYEQGISVPGCHVHFLDSEHSHGGHVLDFSLRSGTVELCVGTDLQLRLPLTDAFSRAELAPEDLQQQIETTE